MLLSRTPVELVDSTEGTVFVSVANRDKRTLIFPIQRLANMGYNIVATAGTAQMLRRNGIDCEVALKASEVRDGAEGTSIVERIASGEIDLILNTPAGSAGARHDGPLALLPSGLAAWTGLDDLAPFLAEADRIDVLFLGMGAELAALGGVDGLGHGPADECLRVGNVAQPSRSLPRSAV